MAPKTNRGKRTTDKESREEGEEVAPTVTKGDTDTITLETVTGEHGAVTRTNSGSAPPTLNNIQGQSGLPPPTQNNISEEPFTLVGPKLRPRKIPPGDEPQDVGPTKKKQTSKENKKDVDRPGTRAMSTQTEDIAHFYMSEKVIDPEDMNDEKAAGSTTRCQPVEQPLTTMESPPVSEGPTLATIESLAPSEGLNVADVLATIESATRASENVSELGALGQIIPLLLRLVAQLSDQVAKQGRALQTMLESRITTQTKMTGPGPQRSSEHVGPGLEEASTLDAPKSYAATTKGSAQAKKRALVAKARRQCSIEPKGGVVLVYPTGEPQDTGEPGSQHNAPDTKAKLLSCLNPAECRIRVKNVKRIRNNGLLVETGRKEDLKILLESESIKKAGFKVEAPKKRMPKLIIFDVPNEMSGEMMLECINKQNLEGNLSPDDEIKPCFKAGRRKGAYANWVIQVTPAMRRRLLELNGGRVYLGWHACKIKDFYYLPRCAKCLGHGHLQKNCTSERRCGHCADPGHSYKECPRHADPARCSNCIKLKKASNHDVRSEDCTAYKRALHRLLAQTDYGISV